jgi:outer membrane autotransporter protein
MHKQIFYTAIALLMFCEIKAASPLYETATSNQKLVAEQIQAFRKTNPEDEFVLNAIADFSTPQREKIFDQMSGQQYTTLFTSTEIINRQFLRSLYDPLRFQIANPCSYTDEVYDICSSKGIFAWTSLKGGRSFLDGNKNAQGFKMSGYGIGFGGQKRLTPCWTFGAGGFYANHHAHYNVGGASKMNTLLGALYTLYRPARYYALADVVFGYSKNTLHRRVNFGTKDHDYHPGAKPNISLVSFYGEAGFDWTYSCLLIQPFVGFEASRFVRSGKSEGGFRPLRVIYPGKEVENAYSRLGVHLTTPENCYDLTFSFDLAWQYRLNNWRNRERMQFERFGSPFDITGVPNERNSISMGMVVWSEILDGWSTYLEASGEVWRRVKTFDFTIGVIFKW